MLQKDVVVLVRWAQLPHVSQQLRRLPAAKGLHSQEELHPLKVGQLVAGKQLIAGKHRVRSDDEMNHLLERDLVQSSCDVAESLALGVHRAHLELGFYCGEPRHGGVCPESRQLQVSGLGRRKRRRVVRRQVHRVETAR